MPLLDAFAEFTASARENLEKIDTHRRRVSDDLKRSADELTHRVSLAVEALQNGEKLQQAPARPPPPPPPPAARPLPPRPPPTASTWRAEENAHWLDEVKRQHASSSSSTVDTNPPAAPTSAFEQPNASIAAATSRLRRSLLLQEARRREEAERAAEATGDDTQTGADHPASEAEPPTRAHSQPYDDEASLIFEDSMQEVETERTAAAARHTAAAEARAAALERELQDTRRRLEETRLDAERAAAEAAAASARSYVRPEPPADDANMCVVCLEEERTHVLIPCGHKCLCYKCAARYEAHMRSDGTYDDGADEPATTASSLKGGAKCGSSSGNKGTAAASSSARRNAPPFEPRHACPLCRKGVTAVHLVWE